MLADALSRLAFIFLRADILIDHARRHIPKRQIFLLKVGLDVNFVVAAIGFIGISANPLFLHGHPVLKRCDQILVCAITIHFGQRIQPFDQHPFRFLFV